MRVKAGSVQSRIYMNKTMHFTVLLLLTFLSVIYYVSADCAFTEYTLNGSTTLKVRSTETDMTLVMESANNAWLGVGVNENGRMIGGVGIIGTPSLGVKKYDMVFKGLSGVRVSNEQTLIDTEFTQDAAEGSRMTYTQLLKDGDQEVPSVGEVTFIWAVGMSNNLGYHASRGSMKVRIEPCTTEFPTKAPTSKPTALPTKTPTVSPTISPTVSPTSNPTAMPTRTPTVSSTRAPTKPSTSKPSASPTRTPTVSPTAAPTLSPTLSPTSKPTAIPTSTPNVSSSPTMAPTKERKPTPMYYSTKKPISAATNSPTAATSTSYPPSPSCVDSPLLFIAQGTPRCCEWVSENPEERCNEMWARGARADINIKSHCPVSCGACEEFSCSDTIGSFILDNEESKECCWLDSLGDDVKRMTCSEGRIQKTCRKSCGFCPDTQSSMWEEEEVE